MTAQELVDLLQHHINQDTIDADDPIFENMGAYCREVISVWVDDGVHLGSQGTPASKNSLPHPPEKL